MNANKLWHDYNRFRKRKAAAFAPAIYRALQAQIQYYVETNDLVNLPQQQLQQTLMSLYTEVGRQWAYTTYYGILKDAGVKPFKQELMIKRRGAIGLNQAFIDDILQFFGIDGFNLITNITQTTRMQIQDIVSKGIEQQWSLDEIIRELETTGVTRMRAARISRTEVGRAANIAATIGAKRTQLVTVKTWLSVDDFRTRNSHVHVDNQTQPSDRPFVVGNERYLMMHPMDTVSQDGRKIPAKEVVNCRCTLGYTALRDEHGLPIRATPTRQQALLPIFTLQ